MKAFFVISFLFICGNLVASHIIGGTISYEYLGPGTQPNTNKYEFILFVYRDCTSPVHLEDPVYISFYEKVNGAYELYYTKEKGISKTRKVTFVKLECMDPPNVCVEQGQYIFTIDLPLTGNPFNVTYQICCRNSTINNIYNPNQVGAVYSVDLTSKAMQLKNSSPKFANLPPIIICNDFPVAYDHSAVDKDGDQLVYSLCSPETAVTPFDLNPPPYLPVDFIEPLYTAEYPMSGNPIVKLDPATGIIDGVPHQLGQYVLGVCVEEYRNGELLSTVRREFQFNVADCKPDVFAEIYKDSIIGFKDYYIKGCGKEDVRFYNYSVAKNGISSFYWEFDLKDGTFLKSTEKNPILTFPDIGVYHGKMMVNKEEDCKDSVLITLDILPGVYPDFESSYDICEVGPVEFTDKSMGDGGLEKWWWQFGDGGEGQGPDHIYQYPTSGEFTVRLSVVDSNNCHKGVEKIIAWQPAPAEVVIAPTTFNGCVPAEIFFDNISYPIDTTYIFEWDFGDGQIDSVMSPTHVYSEEGLYSIGIKLTTPAGCTAEANFFNWIRVLPSPEAAFSYSPEMVKSLDPTVNFIDESIGANLWFWNFDSLATKNEQNPSYEFLGIGKHYAHLRVVHPSGCVDTITKIIDVIPEVSFFMPNAFTPNEDTQNDIFIGKGQIQELHTFRMTIWDRWGQRVFESNSPHVGWNGKKFNEGRPSPPGVYVYKVIYTDRRFKSHELSGFATLIR